MFKDKIQNTSHAEEGIGVSESTENRGIILDGPELDPEKRKEKLALLRKAITEGTYKVRAEEIAGKMLKEMVFELAMTSKYREYRSRRDN